MVAPSPLTELQILAVIYERYYETFADFDRNDQERNRFTKNHVPIDVASVATQLGSEPDIVFGTLYYVLNEKHRIKTDEPGGDPDANSVEVPFFMHFWPPHIAVALPAKYAKERDLVHFPMVAALYASLRDQDSKATWAVRVSIISTCIALASLLATCSK